MILQVLAALALFTFFYWLNFGSPKASTRRHKWRIHTASKVLEKLNAFSGAGVDGRRLLYLRKINPYVFEELILTAFEKNGYQIRRNASYSGDGGLDGQVFDKQGNNCLIQAKRYAGPIKRAHLESFALLCERRGKAGFFVHTGRSAKDHIAAYQQRNVRVISGSLLLHWLLFAKLEPTPAVAEESTPVRLT